MLMHLADAVNKGFKKILLCTVDKEVVVLAVASVVKIEIK